MKQREADVLDIYLEERRVKLGKILNAIQGALVRGRLPHDSEADLLEAEKILLEGTW